MKFFKCFSFAIYLFATCLDAKSCLSLLGVKNFTPEFVEINAVVIRAAQIKSLQVDIPFIPWMNYHSKEIINDGICIPINALPIKIGEQDWFLWQDEFGVKYAPRKDAHISHDDAKIRRVTIAAARAILVLRDSEGKISFEFEKK